METNYSFYMQAVDKNGNLISGTKKDLEKDFEGLRYLRCEGLNAIGKPRVYTEKYADSDRLRSYVPSNITNDATTVKLSLCFMGQNRQKAYDNFNAYVRSGYHAYWDTARNKRFDFFLSDSIDVSDEMWYGSTPYFEATYTLQNLNGKTVDVE